MGVTTNIDGNEKVDTLAKLGCKLDHIRNVATTHKHPHLTPLCISSPRKNGGTQCKKYLIKVSLKKKYISSIMTKDTT